MNLHIEGSVGLSLNEKKVIEINAKENKIVLNIRKIGGIKKLLDIIKAFSDEEKEKEETDTTDTNGKEKINEMLKFLKKQGYAVSIKLKGITIIKDLESSSIAKLMNLI